MADLDIAVTGVEALSRGIIPLLQFNLRVTNQPATEDIQAVLLHAQIQIQPAQRTYTPREKERLSELFGSPDRWGQTLRTRLWTHVHTNLPAFQGSTTGTLITPCTYDLNIGAAKYFHALESGDVSLLFLFSGTVFYTAETGQLQVQPISWNKECTFRLPVAAWRELMDEHFPHSAWLYIDRDVFDRLCQYKRLHGLATWDQTLEQLLPAEKTAEALV